MQIKIKRYFFLFLIRKILAKFFKMIKPSAAQATASTFANSRDEIGREPSEASFE